MKPLTITEAKGVRHALYRENRIDYSVYASALPDGSDIGGDPEGYRLVTIVASPFGVGAFICPPGYLAPRYVAEKLRITMYGDETLTALCTAIRAAVEASS